MWFDICADIQLLQREIYRNGIMNYDAIVVGLGPAGATAAYELSKPDFKSVFERTISKVNFTFKGSGDIHAVSDRPLVHMVMRDVFDNFLV